MMDLQALYTAVLEGNAPTARSIAEQTLTQAATPRNYWIVSDPRDGRSRAAV